MKERVWYVALSMLLSGACIRGSDIDRDEAHRLVHEGALLLDVRSPSEYAEQHPQEAVNIPLGDLIRRKAELGPVDRPIVVYCHTGVRASIAKKMLHDAVYSNVRSLGAVGHWYVDPSDATPSFQ